MPKQSIKIILFFMVLSMGYVKASVSDSGGDKTISPLKGTKVVRPFGEYIDPDFNIKIFKEFVTLSNEDLNYADNLGLKAIYR